MLLRAIEGENIFVEIGRRDQSRVSVCAARGADYGVYEAQGRDNWEEEAKNVFSIVRRP